MQLRPIYRFGFSVPIPPTLSPSDVLAALHGHNYLMSLQPLISEFHVVPPSDYSDFFDADDEHFPSSAYGANTTVYEVTEVITIIPGVGNWAKTDLKFPAVFEDVRDGVRTTAFAPAGVVSKTHYMVAKADDGSTGWVLREEASVQCSFLLMPFVKNTMEEAHKNIVRDLLAKLEETTASVGAAGAAPAVAQAPLAAAPIQAPAAVPAPAPAAGVGPDARM